MLGSAEGDGVAGLGAFGLTPARVGAAERNETAPADLQREARFALSVLAGALGGVYVVAGATLVGRVSTLGLVLVGIGLAQASCGAAVHRGSRAALGVVAAGNVALAGVWLLSRTVGFWGGGVQPVGILDALSAVDSVVLVALAVAALLAARRGPSRRVPGTGSMAQVAVLLAVLTLSALLGGHTHTAQAHVVFGQPAGLLHLYCRLL